jgi:predicted component of type VI protein secretion system
LEQALTAMLIGETEAAVLPADEYMVNPQMKAIEEKTGVLHHYVDLSKEGYFKKAWRMI